MRKINYFEIISDIPFGDEIDFLESEMKIAEHDYFCKPQTFIKGLRQAINDYKRKRIEISEKRRFEIETDLKKDIEELEKDWDKEFCMFEYWKAEKEKEEQPSFDDKWKPYFDDPITYDDYIKQRVSDYKNKIRQELDQLNQTEHDSVKRYDFLLSVVGELEQTVQKAESNLLSLTRSLSPEEQRFLYGQLVEKGFIDKSEDYQNFCFAFGGSPLNREFKKIKWCVKNRQCLRDLLSEIKFHKTDADMLKTVGYYFVDWKGQTMRLPVNNKHDPFSPTEGLMKEILIEFRKL
jgi:hypothetical protein